VFLQLCSCSCILCFCCGRFSSFSTKPGELAGNNVSEMTCFVSSETWNFNSVNFAADLAGIRQSSVCVNICACFLIENQFGKIWNWRKYTVERVRDTRFQGSWHSVERVQTQGSRVHDTQTQGSRVHDTLLRELGHKVPGFMTASLSDFSQEMWSLLNCCRGWSSFAWMQLCGSCGWHKELNSGAPDDYSESNSLAIEWW